MPVAEYYHGKGKKVMKSMKKRYGSKKGASVFYATANKRGLTGSGPFTSSEVSRGYKTLCNASDLRQMDESVTDMKEVLAKRRLPGHLRRSQSTKGKY